MKKIKDVSKNMSARQFVNLNSPTSWSVKLLPFLLAANIALGAWVGDSLTKPLRESEPADKQTEMRTAARVSGGTAGILWVLIMFSIFFDMEDDTRGRRKLRQIASILLQSDERKNDNRILEDFINVIYTLDFSARDKKTLDNMLVSISAHDRKYFDKVASGKFCENDVRAVRNIIVGYLVRHPQESVSVVDMFYKRFGCFNDLLSIMDQYGVRIKNDASAHQR